MLNVQVCIEVWRSILLILEGLKLYFAFYIFNSHTKQSTGTDSSVFFDNKFKILLLPVPPEQKSMNIITNF